MKYVIAILSLISIPALAAEACAPASKEMAQYLSQKNWRAHSVNAAGVSSLSGFVDEKNNFYYSDLTRGGQAPAAVKVDSNNKSFKEFFKYCRADKSAYLRLMRRNREGNVYKIALRYLPDLSDFANDPLAAQNYREFSAEIKVKFEADSSIDKHDTYPDQLKTDLVRQLNKQLGKQKLGFVELDLTGWDDVVCDFIQGRVKIWIDRNGVSDAPTVVQNKEIDYADLRSAHSALKERVVGAQSREQAIFLAARTLSKLEQDRRIENWVDKRGFEVSKRLMTPDMSKVADLSEPALSCLNDQLQTYSRPSVPNYINLQFKAPSLDEIDPTGAAQ